MVRRISGRENTSSWVVPQRLNYMTFVPGLIKPGAKVFLFPGKYQKGEMK